jgi:hypothetical protein
MNRLESVDATDADRALAARVAARGWNGDAVSGNRGSASVGPGDRVVVTIDRRIGYGLTTDGAELSLGGECDRMRAGFVLAESCPYVAVDRFYGGSR